MLLVGQAHSRGKWLSTLAFGGREGVTEQFLDACLDLGGSSVAEDGLMMLEEISSE